MGLGAEALDGAIGGDDGVAGFEVGEFLGAELLDASACHYAGRATDEHSEQRAIEVTDRAVDRA